MDRHRYVITVTVDDENEVVIVVEKNGKFYDEVVLDARDVDEFVDYMKELAYRITLNR